MRAAFVVAVAAVVAIGGCKGAAKKKPKASAATADGGTSGRMHPPPARPPKVEPPMPVDKPPADAERITGVEGAPHAIIYIKRITPGTGEQPGRNDTVRLNFTGWRTNGETYLTTTVRKRPVTQSLAVLAPGFATAVASMHQGERAMMWIPPELGYMGKPTDTPETTVYEVELVGFDRGPATPADVAAPPANAKKSPSGLPYVVLKSGTGKVKPKGYDVVVLAYSAWSSTGRLFDSSEVTRSPRKTFPFREPIGIEEILKTMVVGQRVRVWLPASQLEPVPGAPSGQVCWEMELLELQAKQAPPPTPASVTGPPPGAKTTAHGVAYEVLKPGTGTTHPTLADRVQVKFTGWLTNGRLFDSSEIHGQPAALLMSKLVPGFAEGITTMVTGERTRFWIPVEQAYKNEPGSPPGMLVLECELLDIVATPGKAAPMSPAPAQGVLTP